MAEPISSIPGHPRYDPAKVAGASFDTVRRGFDEVQVRSFLGDLASSLRASHEVEDRLRRELARLEAQVGVAESIDDTMLVERLGEEAAKILNAAREAAATRIQRADEDAAATAERAYRHAADVRARADRVLEEKVAEAEATAAAVLAESEGIIEAARAEAETIVEEARVQGRQMIDETIQHREQMLQSMERRRQRARIQVERLQAGRDRLLASYEIVQRTLDEARSELDLALPEAKIEAAKAARRLEEQDPRTPAELEAELATARVAGLLGADPTVEDGPDAADQPEEAVAEEAVAEEPEPAEEEPTEEAGPEPTDEPEPAEEAVAEEPEESEEPTEEPESAEEEPTEEEPTEEAVAEEPEPESEPPGEPATTRVDDLFAQLRGQPDDADPAEAAPPVPGAPLADDEIAELLARRDLELEPIGVSLARSLKRAMTSSQNDLLDLLRRGSVDDLPDLGRSIVEAAEPALAAAWTAGAGFYGAPPSEPAELDDLSEGFAGRFVSPLKLALADCLSGGGDVAEAIRAVFRDHRGRRLDDEVGDLIAASFNRGIYDATPKRHPIQWVPDETSGPCPAAAGNVAVGPVRRGEHFPSGSPHPPSEPGCRCLLKPVDQ